MELKAYLTVLKRRWMIFLLGSSFVIFLSILGSVFYSPNYEAETRLRVITPLGGSLENPYYQTAFANRLMNTYAQIASSELILNELRQSLGIETLPDIHVGIIPDSEIVQIIVTSSDPALAAKTANALAELTISQQERTTEIGSLSDVFSIFTDRIEELKSELERAEQEHDALIVDYAETAAQLSISDREIQLKENAYENLILTTGTPGEEITRLEGEIETKYQEYQKLSIKSNEYLEKISMVRQTIQNIQSAYTNLLFRYDTVQVTNIMQVSTQTVQIVSPAIEPTKPTGFSRLFVIGLGVICGLIFGVFSAFLIDNLDTRLYGPEQIELITDEPILGIISHTHNQNEENIQLQIESPGFLRDTWILSTKLFKILQDKSIKKILVTSSDPTEGKSTIVAGIANVLALNNYKVLIVDADMRSPQQHLLFGVPNNVGLNTFLCGENANMKDLIQKSIRTNVDLLPSMVESEDPMSIIQSSQFNLLLEQTKKYDVILFDTPALVSAPDAYKLALVTDGVILVAQRGRTTTEDIQLAYTYFKEVGSRFLGVVINQARGRKQSSSFLQGIKQLAMRKPKLKIGGPSNKVPFRRRPQKSASDN